MPDSLCNYYILYIDMLRRIHKHFGSVRVERTCCVVDWQKNSGIRKYANLLSCGTQNSHEGDEDSDEAPEINEDDEGNNSERQVKEREGQVTRLLHRLSFLVRRYAIPGPTYLSWSDCASQFLV